MRKIILMAVAAFLWKKFQERKATSSAASVPGTSRY